MDYEKGILVALYIDDLLISATTTAAVEGLKKALYREFEIKDLGEVEVVISIHIRRNRERRTLSIS